jgi:hypothetical protein
MLHLPVNDSEPDQRIWNASELLALDILVSAGGAKLSQAEFELFVNCFLMLRNMRFHAAH